MTLLYLGLAILFETLGTASLKLAEGFTKPIPSLLVVVGYAAAFFFLGLVTKSMPIGLVYAIWSGLGIVLISIIGHFFFKQHLDAAAIVGIGLIVSGVLVLNVLSKTSVH